MSCYLYQRTRQSFGQLAAGAESCGADELREFGATNINPGYLGFYFCADSRTVYDIVYRTRIFSRLIPSLTA